MNPPAQPEMSSSLLINVQALRLIAALLVVLYHTADQVGATTPEGSRLFEMFGLVGFAGVDLFFVISGFIMAHTTQEQFGGPAAWGFTKRRIARIYSGYWPVFVLTALLLSVWGAPLLSRVAWVGAWFLWPTHIDRLLIGVSWTLIFEMVFYLFFAVIIASTHKNRGRILFIVLLSAALWVIYGEFFRGIYTPQTLPKVDVYESYLLSPLFIEFLAGALLAIYVRGRPNGAGALWLLAGSAMFVACGWVNASVFDGAIGYGYHFWRALIFTPASLAILLGLCRLEHRGLVAPLRLSLIGGGASYALYLIHTQLLYVAYQLGIRDLLKGYSAWVIELSYLALVIVIVIYSVCHWRWIERPVHRVFRRVL